MALKYKVEWKPRNFTNTQSSFFSDKKEAKRFIQGLSESLGTDFISAQILKIVGRAVRKNIKTVEWI